MTIVEFPATPTKERRDCIMQPLLFLFQRLLFFSLTGKKYFPNRREIFSQLLLLLIEVFCVLCRNLADRFNLRILIIHLSTFALQLYLAFREGDVFFSVPIAKVLECHGYVAVYYIQAFALVAD